MQILPENLRRWHFYDKTQQEVRSLWITYVKNFIYSVAKCHMKMKNIPTNTIKIFSNTGNFKQNF